MRYTFGILFLSIYTQVLGENYCFRNRAPAGNNGQCNDLIQSHSGVTKVECCGLGGHGFTTKSNGERCQETCEGGAPPVPAWEEWSPWDPCSATCGRSTQNRARHCSSGASADCPGEAIETRSCSVSIPCPVDGGWSVWTRWSDCSVTCEDGVERRTRTCTFPAPQYGGLECDGNSDETRRCYIDVVCPIHGEWSNWGEWGICTAPRCTDTPGNKLRSRSCISPQPKFGGRYCPGSIVESKVCLNNESCPVDGGFSDWSEWGFCNPDCQPGSTRRRTRQCSKPTPQFRGARCRGSRVDVDVVVCETFDPCPVLQEVPGLDEICDDDDDGCHLISSYEVEDSEEDPSSYFIENSYFITEMPVAAGAIPSYSGYNYPNTDVGIPRNRGPKPTPQAPEDDSYSNSNYEESDPAQQGTQVNPQPDGSDSFSDNYVANHGQQGTQVYPQPDGSDSYSYSLNYEDNPGKPLKVNSSLNYKDPGQAENSPVDDTANVDDSYSDINDSDEAEVANSSPVASLIFSYDSSPQAAKEDQPPLQDPVDDNYGSIY